MRHSPARSEGRTDRQSASERTAADPLRSASFTCTQLIMFVSLPVCAGVWMRVGQGERRKTAAAYGGLAIASPLRLHRCSASPGAAAACSSLCVHVDS